MTFFEIFRIVGMVGISALIWACIGLVGFAYLVALFKK
jgi:hypothetical protein